MNFTTAARTDSEISRLSTVNHSRIVLESCDGSGSVSEYPPSSSEKRWSGVELQVTWFPLVGKLGWVLGCFLATN